MIRLIASDMDGTLLNNQGKLSEKTVNCSYLCNSGAQIIDENQESCKV